MHSCPNIFAGIPALPFVPDHASQELIDTLLRTPMLRIERIVSHGQASPEGFWYDQDESEWVLVLSGAARMTFEGEESLQMTAGSFVNIPAHRRHRIDWTDPSVATVWLAIHYS